MNSLLILGANGQDGLTIASLERLYNLNITYVQRKKIQAKNYICVEQLCEISYAKILDTVKPNFVLNLIGQSSVGKSFRCEKETFFANYILAKSLMNVTLEYSDAHFLQASSAYIFNCISPINFNSSINAISPYAKSKAQLYQEMQSKRISYFHLFNHISRYSSLNFVLPKIARKFRQCNSHVSLELAGLNKSRDWGFSSDYMSIILHLCTSKPSQIKQEYFVGSGLQMSIIEIVDVFSHITDKSYSIVSKEDLKRPYDPDYVIFDKDSCLNQGILLPNYNSLDFLKVVLNTM